MKNALFKRDQLQDKLKAIEKDLTESLDDVEMLEEENLMLKE